MKIRPARATDAERCTVVMRQSITELCAPDHLDPAHQWLRREVERVAKANAV